LKQVEEIVDEVNQMGLMFYYLKIKTKISFRKKIFLSILPFDDLSKIGSIK
jgi:hypothetical protein